jgi:CubicO group peptidase (beta-lactamase class C family)
MGNIIIMKHFINVLSPEPRLLPVLPSLAIEHRRRGSRMAGVVLAVWAIVLPAGIAAASAASSGALPRSHPEAQGVSSASLLTFIEALDRVEGMHSVMLVRRGNVIAEGWWAPYRPEHNHELYSLSKSFTSTAVGFAVAEGRVSLDDEVLKFFPKDAPADPGNNLQAMRVRDLLTMSTGHQDEPPSAVDKISARSFLAQAVPHKPGTHFKYNTPATFMLSAILQEQTGQTVAEYLQPRLFGPLGITQPVWRTNFQGITLGGYGLSVRTEDIARFGQLYLQKGRWNGRQLLPESWIALATSRQVSNGSNPRSDWDQGYGFQFWRCRHGAYRGDGAFGQYCLVMPEQEAVLAITSGVKEMQAVLNVVWDTLLPAMQSGRARKDAGARRRLAERLAGLTVPPAMGAASSPRAPAVLGRTYAFPTNAQQFSTLTLKPMSSPGTGVVLSLAGEDGRRVEYPAQYQQWLSSRGEMGILKDTPVASSVAWTAEDTCVLKVCAVETPFVRTWTMRFTGEEVLLDDETNVGFGRTRQAPIVGRAAGR